MDTKTYLRISDSDRIRFESLYARYRLLHDAPEQCSPMIIIYTPVDGLPTWEARLADPFVMLRADLDQLQPHLEMQDDRVPTVRVQFGTAQVAAAFGCHIVIPENNLPAAGDHVLAHADASRVYAVALPSLDAGWYGKLAEWTAIWRENLPEGVHIQHPDIQSAFNSAHLIRGNEILTDFYDHPAELDLLLDKVTDFMVAILKHTKAAISEDPDWFFDWGALWKGAARISNCSMHMISPRFYREHVLARDIRFFEQVGGGRMHYCGTSKRVIDEFFKAPLITGLDVDTGLHDFYDLCRRAPAHVVLMPTMPFKRDSVEVRRMLAGDWPAKRNIVISVEAASVEEGRALLRRLRSSLPD